MQCIFVGYPYNSKGYKLYNAETKQMLRSRDVIFLEDTFESDLSDCNQDKELLLDEKPSVKLDPIYFEGGVNINNDNENHENCMRDINVDDVIPATEGRPQRNRIAPDRLGAITGNWWNYVDYASIAVADNDEPRNVREAFTGQNAKQWKGATDAEFQSLLKNQTWDLVDLPEDKKVIGCKWVFKLKRDANGEITRYKARLVAQGYSQEAGIDYDEVFAPVAKYDSIRSILAIANQLDLEVHQMDVKTAFLHGDLDNEIYMKQPEGYIDITQPDKVCKLRKSLYGLKQSARCWNVTIDRSLKESGYVQSTADPCIYTKIEERNGRKCLMIIAVYVDDIVLASNDIEMLNAEKARLNEQFDMEDLGEIHYCLGMSVKRDRAAKITTINQKVYLENVLKRFGMSDCKPVSTPMEPGRQFVKLDDGDNPVNMKEYQAAIRSLIYASIASRPDLSAAVGILSRFMSNPGQEHWSGVKRIFRYVKGTLDFGLKFEASHEGQFNLYGYSDAD